MSTTMADTKSAVEELHWWHSIDLPGGIRTPGHQRIEAQEFIAGNIPQDLSGKSVLDIGANDGYFSFLAEKRKAARVLAIDVWQGDDIKSGRIGVGKDGEYFLKTFDLAKKALKSRVAYENMNLFDIPSLQAKFDVIFLFGVYYHLEDPLRAFRIVSEKLNPGGLLLFEGLVRAGNRRPLLYRFRGSEMEPTTFCSANIAWLTESLRSLGLERVGAVSFLQFKNRLLNLVIKLAWTMGFNFGPFKKSHRAFISFQKVDIVAK